MLGKYKYILIVIAAGAVLLLIPASGGGEKATEDAGKTHEMDVSSEERRLEEALGEAEGVGRVRVVLAVRESGEAVYEKDVQENGKKSGAQGDLLEEFDKNAKTVIVSKGSGIQEPVVIKRTMPRYMGAVVVCEGADNPKVELAVVSAVRSATGLSSDKITVIRMKSGG